MSALSADEIFQRVRPSIVSIRSGTSTGTGFYATASGIIVTNAHVVGYAREVYILDADRRETTACVFAVDLRLDIALLASSTPRPALPLADSRAACVGERVLAVGDPLGLPATATQGIVSAIRRISRRTGVAYLQTDAALNAGNSGGPLIDEHGCVVGVNTMIAGAADGVGFAVPVDAFRGLLQPFEHQLPDPLPAPTYGCAVCELAHSPSDRWCAGCGSRLGLQSRSEDVGQMRAGSLTANLIEALGFDPAACRVSDSVWRLEANGAEVWVDVLANGHALAFSSRLGMLPTHAPLPVLRFLAAANDRSVGPCRLAISYDNVIVAEVVEPTAFADIKQIAITLGQLAAVAAELRTLLTTEFQVAPPLHRFVTGGFSL
ncbi:MAG: trypsin-like serine protease [Kofleriaceae bacterium]|nr:trypsin-like serine protease [Kofleriaceae bacterium]